MLLKGRPKEAVTSLELFRLSLTDVRISSTVEIKEDEVILESSDFAAAFDEAGKSEGSLPDDKAAAQTSYMIVM